MEEICHSDIEKLASELKQEAENIGISVLIARVVMTRRQFDQLFVLLLERTVGIVLAGQEEPPGGKVEKGEDLIAAAIREVKEETGLTISSELAYLCHLDFISPEGKAIREFYFYAETEEENIHLHPQEHCCYRWVEVRDLVSTSLHPDILAILSSNIPTFA